MSPEEIAGYLHEVHAFYQRLPAARFPVLASIAADMTGPDDVERFEFGLTALIAGFEVMSRSG